MFYVHDLFIAFSGWVACNQPVYLIDVSDIRPSVHQYFGFLAQTHFRRSI